MFSLARTSSSAAHASRLGHGSFQRGSVATSRWISTSTRSAFLKDRTSRAIPVRARPKNYLTSVVVGTPSARLAYPWLGAVRLYQNGRGGPQGFRIQPTPEQSQKGKALELYGTDLTKRASEGKLDPVIGREEEIRRTIQ
ncbi:chaperone ATPase hsp78, partial [Podila epicladia]